MTSTARFADVIALLGREVPAAPSWPVILVLFADAWLPEIGPTCPACGWRECAVLDVAPTGLLAWPWACAVACRAADLLLPAMPFPSGS
jgi:hypothetical protein